MIDFVLEFLLSRGQTWSQIEFDQDCKVLSEATENDTKIIRYHLKANSGVGFTIPYKSPEETVTDSHGKIVRDQTVKIYNIWADDIKLDMKVVLSMFEYVPKYRQDFIDYCNDNNIDLSMQSLHALEFWHAGYCKISWQESFWVTYSQQRRSLQRPNQIAEEQQNYVGYDSGTFQGLLAPLKNKLKQCDEQR